MNPTTTGIVTPLRPSRARTDAAPWYRQPWLWFVIGLPAISVVFSFATLYVAVTHADAVVPHEESQAVYAIPQPAAAKAGGGVAVLPGPATHPAAAAMHEGRSAP